MINDKAKAATLHTHYYEFRLTSYLNQRWSDWFDGLVVSYDHKTGDTILSGEVADQAALHGVFAKIRDLNLTLISVNRKEQP